MRRTARAGFTLVEIAISSVVFAVILLATMGATLSAQGEFDDARARERVAARTQHALESVRDALVDAGLTGMTPVPTGTTGSNRLTFRSPTGIVSGTVTWGTQTTVRFEASPDDPDNNRDDDGDGAVDEGRVVLVRDVGTASETTTVLATDVPERMPGEVANNVDDNGNGLIDESGLAFSLDGTVLTIQLATLGRGETGAVVVNVQETSISIRN